MRCFTDNINIDNLVEFLKKETNVLLIVFEVSHGGNRPHIHATIEFKNAVNTFRDKLRKEFPELFGNKSYSISKVRDYDSNIKYCLKGKANDYPHVLYTTLLDEDVKQYYYEYWKLKQTICNNKKEAELKTQKSSECCDEGYEAPKKKPKVLTWSLKLKKYIKDNHPDIVHKYITYFNSYKCDDYAKLQDQLVEIILDHLGRDAKNLDDFIICRFYNAQVNSIIKESNDDKAKQNFAKDLADRNRARML